MKRSWVYIIASEQNGTLYIGVTGNLWRRIYQHKNGIVRGFAKKYAVTRLVYFEEFQDIHDAIYREKCMKKFSRAEKLRLIEESNPLWQDLYETLGDSV